MLRKGFKRNLLFFLSFCADIYSELSVRSFYRNFYAPGAYKPETVTQYLSRMARVGEIGKKVVRGKAVFVISTKGERLLDEVIPLKKLGEEKWDGWWRIVIFDIEEKNRYARDMIRKKLIELGFGMWQKSVYITPHPVAEEINEYFEEKDLYPRCICLEARKAGVKDDRRLAEQVFGLEELTTKYAKLSDEIKFETETHMKINAKSKNVNIRLQTFLDRFEELLFIDPFLPKELSAYYEGREKTQEAIALFSKIVAKSK